MSAPFAHLLLTRFNLPFAEFGTDKAGALTRTPEWLSHRLALFRHICVPSVRAQSARDFTWLILVDAATDPTPKAEIAGLVADLQSSVIECTAPYSWRDLLHRFVAPGQAYLATTRLDNDDAIAPLFMATVQRHVREAIGGQVRQAFPRCINLSKGLEWDGERLFERTYPSNNFSTLVARLDDPAAIPATIYDYNHSFLPDLVPIHDVHTAEPLWLQTVHLRNAGNRIAGQPVADSVAPSAAPAFLPALDAARAALWPAPPDRAVLRVGFDRSRGWGDLVGCHPPETWGAWTVAPTVAIGFARPVAGDVTLRLLAHGFLENGGRPLMLSLAGSGQEIRLPSDGRAAEVTARFRLDRPTRWLEIAGMLPIAPQQRGLSDDRRSLGIGLHRLTIEVERR